MIRLAVGALCVFFPLLAKAYCFEAAGARYGVSPILLKAIQQQENGKGIPELTRTNSNGTVDYGLMGINSVHLPQLSRYGITPSTLLDPCVNVSIGAWLVATLISKHGMSWQTIGRYHSATEWRRDDYAQKIQRKVVALVRS